MSEKLGSSPQYYTDLLEDLSGYHPTKEKAKITDRRMLAPSPTAEAALEGWNTRTTSKGELKPVPYKYRTQVAMVKLIERNGGFIDNPSTVTSSPDDLGFTRLESVAPVDMLNSYRDVRLATTYDEALGQLSKNLAHATEIADDPDNPDKKSEEGTISFQDALSFDALQNYRMLQWKVIENEAPADRSKVLRARWKDIANDYMEKLGIKDQYSKLPTDAKQEVLALFRDISIDTKDDDLSTANLVEYGREHTGPGPYNLRDAREYFAASQSEVLEKVGIAHPFSGEIVESSAKLLGKQADDQYAALFLKTPHRKGFGTEESRDRALGALVKREATDIMSEYQAEHPNILPSVLELWREDIARKMVKDILLPSYVAHLKSAPDSKKYEEWIKVSEGRKAFHEKAETDPALREAFIRRVMQYASWWRKDTSSFFKRNTVGRIGLKGGFRRQSEIHDLRGNRSLLDNRVQDIVEWVLDEAGVSIGDADYFKLTD